MATSSRSLLRLVALAAALAAGSARAVHPADEGPRLVAGQPGPIVGAPSGRGEAEVVTFDPRVAASLIALAPEESLRIEEWPVAPGVRRPVLLTRHEIYAADARIIRVDGARVTEVPRSRLVFLWGSQIDGEGSRLMVSVDPGSGELRGLSRSSDGFNELVPERRGRHLLGRPEDLVTGDRPTWSCGQEDFPGAAFDRSRTASARSEAGRTPALITSLHIATVAFDTDNELMLQKFNDDTTSAANYIASLVASINVMYERDLLLRLLQGFTVLRVSTTADPWNATGSPANGTELNEFGDYWKAHYGSVSRAVAAMLSGKSSSPYSASGIAWVGGLCGGSYGFSFSQVFKISYLAGDTLVVGHEIGHNLGSPHTHCYSNTPLPAPDHCWNGEPCYGGATSCPAPQTINGVTGVTGTIMSYCHLRGDCDSYLVFHPRTVNEFVGPPIQSAVGTCVFPVSEGGGPAASSFHTLPPCRVVDTRNPNGPLGGPALAAQTSRAFTLSGSCGIPSGATGVSMNITVADATNGGSLRMYPGTGAAPGTNTISFSAGANRANNVVLGLTNGVFSVQDDQASGTVNLIVDVNGYFQ